ncbi:MAG: hypothetical protein Q9202_006973 [Teloschistes flavicans]
MRSLSHNLLLHHRPLSRIPLRMPSHHAFHSTPHPHSALFNLGGLSTSRESQYFSKERGIPRTEFSPQLQLIRSSEVDTQKRPSDLKPTLSASSKASNSTTSQPPSVPLPREKPTTLKPAPTLTHLHDSLTSLQTSHAALTARLAHLEKKNPSSTKYFTYLEFATAFLLAYIAYELLQFKNSVDARIAAVDEAERERRRGEQSIIDTETKGADEILAEYEDAALHVAAATAGVTATVAGEGRQERAWRFADLLWARRD